jgi:uncharacterized protein (TIGR02231 family)
MIMEQLNTSLKAVTVYPDRARVMRQGTIALDAGLHTLVISELPLQINADSLRAGARGTGRSRLLGVQVQRSFFSETPAEKVRQLEQEVEARQDDLKKLDAQVELALQNRQILDKLAGHTEMYAAALAAGEMSVDAQLALLDGLGSRAGQLDDSLQALAVRRRGLERELQKLTKELEQQRSARPRERYQANIELEVLQPGELTLELSYVIAGAHWKPFYDLRLIEGESQPTLELGYLAQVGQNTGESWDGVSLTLSTARPAMARSLPELDPWFISPPAPPMVLRSAAAPAAPQQMKMRAVHAKATADIMELGRCCDLSHPCPGDHSAGWQPAQGDRSPLSALPPAGFRQRAQAGDRSISPGVHCQCQPLYFASR